MEDKPKERPLQVGEITKIGEDLSGKSIVGGKVYSFRYTNLGDIVEFRFFGRGKRKREKIERIIRKSEWSNVNCTYFGSCGGCSAQHIPYSEQFALQTNRLAELYKEFWDLNCELIPSQNIYHYRNRMDFSIFPEKFGQRQAGNFRNIIDLESCSIQSDWANGEWKKVREYLKENPLLPQDRKTDQGSLKYITLRKGIYTNDTMSISTFSQEKRESSEEKKWEEWLLAHSSADNIVFCYNPRPSEVSSSGEFRVVRGNPYYKEKIRGRVFEVPFDAFFQPNPTQFEPILQKVEKWWVESEKKVFLDLFCGGGFFSLLFGANAETILGYDSFLPSVEMAQKLVTASFPGKNVEFKQVDLFQKKHLEKFLDSFRNQGVKPEDSFLVLDPPRNGVGAMVVDWILESGIEKIAYVSCNPKKQWEEIMNGLGKLFVPVSAMITDPYPHTPHLESVVLLEKKRSPGIRDFF